MILPKTNTTTPRADFFPILVRRKKFIRSQADLCGPRRTVSGPPPVSTINYQLPNHRRADSSRQSEAAAEALAKAGPLFSPGPTTRQYAAISGNKRTEVQFLAAYCRLSVRLLPRNQFFCRLLPPSLSSSVGAPVSDPADFGLWTQLPHAPGPVPVLNCQRTRFYANERKIPNSGSSSSGCRFRTWVTVQVQNIGNT